MSRAPSSGDSGVGDSSPQDRMSKTIVKSQEIQDQLANAENRINELLISNLAHYQIASCYIPYINYHETMRVYRDLNEQLEAEVRKYE